MSVQRVRYLIIQPLILVNLGFVFALMGFASCQAFASSDFPYHDTSWKSQVSESFSLAQLGGSLDCRGPRHRGRGKHCPEMSHEKDCSGGMGSCSGRKGMGRRMPHGGGQSGSAQCPQSRTTAKAPEEFYNRTNPLTYS